MNCEEVEQNDILGAYIAGKLPEAQRDQFEEHFFGCEECLHNVEAARLAQEVLLKQAVAPRRPLWIPFVAAAALVICGVALWRAIPQHKPPVAEVAKPKAAPSYEYLARFDPPSYRASTLRGAEKTAQAFKDAMKFYSAGDFSNSAKGLRNSNTLEALYYRGVSELLSGARAEGIADLAKVIAAGDTPYLSESRFYLAKGLIGAGDFSGARQQLNRLIEEKSELAPRAAEIAAQLPAP